MDRSQSLRVLGLPPSASDDEVRVAYWSLRAHVEARLAAAPADVARAEELAQLDAMWEWFAAPGAGEPPRADRRRLAVVAALLATALAAALFLWPSEGRLPPVLRAGGGGDGGGAGLAVAGEGPVDEGAPGGEAGRVVADRVRLVADAGIEGAVLEVAVEGESEPLASGPADDRAYWVEPGEYTLRVSHPDCDQDWEQRLAAEPGGTHELAPKPCSDTSWLVVRANVDSAQVEVDGRPLGASGPERHPVAPGERQVRVTRPGFEEWEGIVELEPGRALRLQPQLARASSADPPTGTSRPAGSPPPAAPRAQPAAAPKSSQRAQGVAADESLEDPEIDQNWHQETRRWLLARYDIDGSGALDSAVELEDVSCEYWQAIERSYDHRLGLPLLRMYGFDGDGWKDGRLGVDGAIRDLAFQRMRDCGLRY